MHMSKNMSKKVPRIPLEKRIAKEALQRPDFMKVFEIFTEDYFICLSEISGDYYYAECYERFVQKVIEYENYYTLSQCIYCVDDMDDLEDEDRNAFLYYVLIEPFAKIAFNFTGKSVLTT